MKRIKLTRGKFTKVDDVDFEWISQWKWYCSNFGYAVRNACTVGGDRFLVYMHREIMKTPDRMDTDHVDMDRLNNQRKNLRICTRSENKRNRGKQLDNVSGYKGVSWSRIARRWQAQIKIKGKSIHLGYFTDVRKAAHIYDDAALKYHGEFARLNYGENLNGK